MSTQENDKDLSDIAARLRQLTDLLYERKRKLGWPGSLTQDHSLPRWHESNDDGQADYDTGIEEMSIGGKPYRERR